MTLGRSFARGAAAARDAVAPGSRLRRPLRDVRERSEMTLRRATAGSRMLPTIIVIGAQKGGTTSLHEYLADHPAVGSSAIKEVQYFSHNSYRGLDWYRAHFPRIGEYPHAIESSPYYLFHPCAPARVRATVPDARLIAVLRDPVDRARSHHNHQFEQGFEQLDFATALAREPERLAGEEEKIVADPRYQSFAHQHYSYAARGFYAGQLERWYALFGADQILVVASEDLFADPRATVHRVQSWLGLFEHTPSELAARGSRAYKPAGDAMRAELGARFRDDSARLAELTGVTLPWAPAAGS